MKEVLSKNEKEFMLSSIQQGLRIDGRRLDDMRDVKISFGKEYGMVEVQLGRTRVYTSVSCEVAEPRPERPNEGFFVFNTNISQMSNVEVDIGRSNPAELELGRLVERGLKESRAIDTEALCIVAGQKVWRIVTNIHILDDCGNLLDCASISVITALLHFRKPDVTLVGNEATIHTLEEREPVPLSIHHYPVSVTFGFFPDSLMIVDPDAKEEMVIDGKLSFLVNVHKEICGVSKSGGMSTSIDQVIKCSKMAINRAFDITNKIRIALHESIKDKNSSMKTRKKPMEMVEYTVPIKEEEEKDNKQSNINTTTTTTPNKPTTTTIKKTTTQPKKQQEVVVEKQKVKEEKKDTDILMKDDTTTTTTTTKPVAVAAPVVVVAPTAAAAAVVKNQSKEKIQIDSDSDSEEEDTVVLSTSNNNNNNSNNTTATTTKTEAIEVGSDDDLSVALIKKPSKPAAKKTKPAAKKAAASK
ncbi:Putative exosome complex exonuclease RRP45 [Cavenderia fasciculata]|uniref:Exosome complex component RRP45 n=1 Tax=Cavenderia fasciculata TaxID=261658 RepID=F4QBL7_CACFS|nr:Putative exosome complex exonuclease RRP45 [Cavenderia fasciculata]EGG14605.1 Putative exosome complex exonuclease RRP45 [Cavenderia fasciculata]|eukprot:XP_004351113.1 Putative exosome complex exonuclease RRP45 [Cavenderia fasciculata]